MLASRPADQPSSGSHVPASPVASEASRHAPRRDLLALVEDALEHLHDPAHLQGTSMRMRPAGLLPGLSLRYAASQKICFYSGCCWKMSASPSIR